MDRCQFYRDIIKINFLSIFNVLCPVPGPPPPDYGPGRERPEVYNGAPGPGYPGGPQYRRPPDYQVGTCPFQMGLAVN